MSTTTKTEQLLAIDVSEQTFCEIREWALSEIVAVAASIDQRVFVEIDFDGIDAVYAKLDRIAAASAIVRTPIAPGTTRVTGPRDLLAGGLRTAVDSAADVLPDDYSLPGPAADQVGRTMERMADVREALLALSRAEVVEVAR